MFIHVLIQCDKKPISSKLIQNSMEFQLKFLLGQSTHRSIEAHQ